MAQQNTSERKPYVAYRINAEVREVGIGHNIRDAIRDFLAHHKLEGVVTDFETDSSKMSGTLVLYDNGVYDVNMTSLENCIAKSGKMPTPKGLKPKGLTIKPIPIGEVVVAGADPETIRRYKQEQKDLRARVGEAQDQQKAAEASVQHLTSVLTERQKALDGAVTQIAELAAEKQTLERRLADPVVHFNSALSAILKGCMTFTDDYGVHVLEIEEDYEKLHSAGNIHLCDSMPSLTLLNYVRAKHGLAHTSTEDELRGILRYVAGSSWDETPKAKAHAALVAKYAKSLSFLEQGKSDGIDETVLAATQNALDAQKQKLDESEKALAVDKQVYYDFKGVGDEATLDKRVAELKGIKSRAENRKDFAYQVLFHITGKEHEVVDMYLPTLGTVAFVNGIVDVIKTHCPTATHSVKNGLLNVRYAVTDHDSLAQINKDLAAYREGMFHVLGINPKITTLVD